MTSHENYLSEVEKLALVVKGLNVLDDFVI